MSDLVTRLAKAADDEALGIGEAWAGLEEAADEIERLRAELDRISRKDADAERPFYDAVRLREERDEAVALLREIDEWFRQEGAFPDYIQARLDALLSREGRHE